MKKQTAMKVKDLRELAGSMLMTAMEVELPPLEQALPDKRFASEAAAIKFFSDWTTRARRMTELAGQVTGVLEHLITSASFIDDEVNKLDLFAEARSILEKKEKEPSFGDKAYSAARVALAVKEGFKK